MKKLCYLTMLSILFITCASSQASFRKTAVACIKSCNGSRCLRPYRNIIEAAAYKASQTSHKDGNYNGPTLLHYSVRLNEYQNHPEFSKIAKIIIETQDYAQADQFLDARKKEEKTHKTSDSCDDLILLGTIVTLDE